MDTLRRMVPDLIAKVFLDASTNYYTNMYGEYISHSIEVSLQH